MTRSDQQILCTALAYIAVYLQSPAQAHEAEPASLLARHIDAYCQQNAIAKKDNIVEETTPAAEPVDGDTRQAALNDALTALESILKDGLTFSTEQAIEKAITRIRGIQA